MSAPAKEQYPVEVASRYQEEHYSAANWVPLLRPAVDLARLINNTDFVPTGLRGNGPAVAAAILTGHELGIGPMAALRSVHIIEGRPFLAAELMRGLAYAAGHHLEVIEATTARCRVRARRHGDDSWQEFTWTVDDAARAGLAGRPNWRKDPRSMLIARATALACRTIMSDLTMGISIVEELDHDGIEPGAPPAPNLPDVRIVDGQPVPPQPRRTARRRPLPAGVGEDPAGSAAPPQPPTPNAPGESATAVPAPAPPPLPGEANFDTYLDETGPHTAPQAIQAAARPSTRPATPPPTQGGAQRMSTTQRARLMGLLPSAAKASRDSRLAWLAEQVDRPLGTMSDLTAAEADMLIEALDPTPPLPDEAPPDD